MSVILHGAFEGTNFGDTLLLQLFADEVRALGYRQVFATNASKHAASFSGVTPISRRDAIVSRMPVVFCGGGYFGEPPKSQLKWRFQLWQKHLSVALPVALLRRKSAILGVGLGPLDAWWVRAPVALTFDNAEICAVRDAESVEFGRQALKKDCIQVADTVLGCTKASLLRIAGSDTCETSEGVDDSGRRRIVLHLSGDAEDMQARLALARGAIALLQEREDVQLVLVSDKSPGSNGDFFHWFDALGSRVTKVPFSHPGQLLRELSGAWGVVTTKLHVGICAAVLGKRLVSTPRHPKTLRLFRQLRRTDVCRPLEEVAANAVATLQPMFLGSTEPVTVPVDVMQDARRIWELMKAFLSDRTPEK